MAIKHVVFRKRGMISLELSSLLLALLRVSAIWKTDATVELARRVGAGMPQSQGFSAIRALRWQFHATEDVRQILSCNSYINRDGRDWSTTKNSFFLQRVIAHKIGDVPPHAASVPLPAVADQAVAPRESYLGSLSNRRNSTAETRNRVADPWIYARS